MIDLRASRTNIDDKAVDWKDRLKSFLFDERPGKVKLTEDRRTVSKHATFYEKMEADADYRVTTGRLAAAERDWVKKELSWFKRNFETVVLADEQELSRQKKNYVRRASRITTKGKNALKELMEDLYTKFTQSDSGKRKSISHYFFEELNIRTCPYCNRQYTFTLSEEDAKTSPEYDHFYSKSDYPILAVSFYNLVPSCHVCNLIKGVKKTVKLNPYFGGFKSKFRLYDKKKDGNKLNALEILSKGEGFLRFDGANRAERSNIKAFGLGGLYELHDDYVKDIIEKAAAYNKVSREVIADTFQKRGFTPDQVFDYVWGKYLDDSQLENRVLSKLTKDLLEQLEIKK